MALKRMAICYDFDKTLAPDDMQAFTFIPSLGMESEAFWLMSNQMAEQNGMDKNLAWMKMMLDKASARKLPITRQAFRDLGKDVKLYRGVEDWFCRVNAYAEKHGIEVQHFIISSGLKEIIEGSSIAPYISRIYASTFLYSRNDIAQWPAQAVNYTNKTQYIFRIAKGAFEENDNRVNESYAQSELYIPYENMIYIGDSDTDIPCMRLIKSKGGASIGVYDPEKNDPAHVHALFRDGRINYYAPADYRPMQPLFCLIKKIIDLTQAREALKDETNTMRSESKIYPV